jgi:hypothetical protein
MTQAGTARQVVIMSEALKNLREYKDLCAGRAGARFRGGAGGTCIHLRCTSPATGWQRLPAPLSRGQALLRSSP